MKACYKYIFFTGMTGPRGRHGKPGINGKPGLPGVSTWLVEKNDTLISDLLIPPSITGGGTVEALRPIVVAEGQHLRLRCAATGKPIPHVEWRREDGKPITVGAWQGMHSKFYSLAIITTYIKLIFLVEGIT